MKGLKVELPDYVWVALKKRAAEEMVSLRHVIMTALREKGIPINDADMIEDGRRFEDNATCANAQMGVWLWLLMTSRFLKLLA